MSQLGPSGAGEVLSQSQSGAIFDASQLVGQGADDGLPSQGEFGFYGYASQGSQMDFDFKEGMASQAGDWAHAAVAQLDEADGITGFTLCLLALE
jgi:hypothetical protein